MSHDLARAGLQLALLAVVPPLLPGIVSRVKARVAGRKGPPLLQLYSDLARLCRKGEVKSTTAGAAFHLGPVVAAAGALAAGLLVPGPGSPALLAFRGDLFLLAGLLAAGRFCTVLSALDTGSAFEGMGAAREVTFASLAEPALFLCLLTLSRATGELSLSAMLGPALGPAWALWAPALLLCAVALFVVALAENSRIPVDDPTTHLELTMIHEVMVLDHSGPDLALVLYGAAVKLYVFGALLARLLLGGGGQGLLGGSLSLLVGLALFAIAVGLVESTMARLRLARVPQLLVGAGVLSLFAFVLLVR
ncbi:respiratory chain complex I subunit 1 family protein [Anaeromyxobacter paludicola]|uniref:Hydrogenase n=1 Tax=Anaeromyxobacter paludicola TaxID=2918171 RepID=A0ABM7XEU6_9BACT|nr:NADH-quinone oxidoreductase subunit H [Anaeromyxobacter paludicola]BDG10413.1 hydrogenase [Anaeromyxobacter paludicola]